MLFVLRMFRNHLFPGIHIDYTHNNDNIFGCFSTCNNNFDNRNNIGNSCPVTADNMHGQWFRAVIVLRRCELFRLYKRHVGLFLRPTLRNAGTLPLPQQHRPLLFPQQPLRLRHRHPHRRLQHRYVRKTHSNAVEPRYSSAVMVDGSTLSRIPRRAGMLLRVRNRIVTGCRNKSGIDNLWYRHYNPHVHWIGGGCYSRIGNDNGWKKKRFKPPTRRTFNPEITFLRRKQPEGPRL